MKVTLDYGKHGITVTIPETARVTVVEPQKGVPLPDPSDAVERALVEPIGSRPLADLARGRENAVIVISDKTRPVPNQIVLPAILATLERAGIRHDRIEILVATGLHRPNDEAELDEMVGAAILARYRIRNHVARDAHAHTNLGRTERGTEILIDRGYIETDLKIVTGLIEPHLMAGYSGGRKAVVPGLAAVETMRSLHGAAMLEGHIGPGILAGNPFHDELLQVVRRVGVDFMVDVTLDRERRLTGVFAGDIEKAHAACVGFLEPHVHAAIDEPGDIVVVSAGGYPLDQTFYQAIKGLTAAFNVVRPGGTVVLVAELGEGLGSADFVALLESLHGHRSFMERISAPDFFRVDQWMVQHLCQVLRKADVVVCSPCRELAGLRTLPLRVEVDADRVLAGLLESAGSRLVVLPQGPYVLATVQGERMALGSSASP